MSRFTCFFVLLAGCITSCEGFSSPDSGYGTRGATRRAGASLELPEKMRLSELLVAASKVGSGSGAGAGGFSSAVGAETAGGSSGLVCAVSKLVKGSGRGVKRDRFGTGVSAEVGGGSGGPASAGGSSGVVSQARLEEIRAIAQADALRYKDCQARFITVQNESASSLEVFGFMADGQKPATVKPEESVRGLLIRGNTVGNNLWFMVASRSSVWTGYRVSREAIGIKVLPDANIEEISGVTRK